ncbi:hypothetical protein [Candidatus Regiella endosymbiont of Tuberolachnus salignus]|uniref:hypothetical protein n=1 Tax=Candidatus Regiella endosymbiont of Tuberolachnus salignus TaxID=3077956 RepID=UPI0030CA8268
MSRVDIEGAIPLWQSIGNNQTEDGSRKRERFLRHLRLDSCPKLVKKNATQSELLPAEQWANYRITSGVLNGTLIRVHLRGNGILLQLFCPNNKTKKRVLSVKKRWQRSLIQLGIPCELEVIDAVDTVP